MHRTFSLTRTILVAISCWGLSINYSIAEDDQEASSCVRKVIIDDSGITGTTVLMTPFRSVNLIFPFDLPNDDTMYALSSSSLWSFEKANNSNVVPVNFVNFSRGQWGVVHDFTIASGDQVFSIGLTTSPTDHCSNILFDYSDEHKTRIAQQVIDEQKAAPPPDDIDELIEERTLTILAQVLASDPQITPINSSARYNIPGAGAVNITVQQRIQYDDYIQLLIEVVYDASARRSITIESVNIEHHQLSGATTPVLGLVQYQADMTGGDEQKIVFSTLTALPRTGIALVMETDKGVITLDW